MLGPIAETLGDICYGQGQSKKFLETLVMLGPFQETLLCQLSNLLPQVFLWIRLLAQDDFQMVSLFPIWGTCQLRPGCYVRFISADIQVPRSSLGDGCQLRTTFKWLAYSKSEGTCYLSPTLKEIGILVQITVWFSFLGYLRLNSWGKAHICSCYAFWHFSP